MILLLFASCSSAGGQRSGDLMAVNLNGRIYRYFQPSHDDTLDENYIFMGIITSYVSNLIYSTVNLQTNHPTLLNARAYHFSDNLMVVLDDGTRVLYRFMGESVDGWQIIEPVPDYLLDECEYHPPTGWEPAPSIHVNGRIYTVYGRGNDVSELLDDSFAFVGVISSHRWSLIDPVVNLQANHPQTVGARLYLSDDYLITVYTCGFHSLYRFRGQIAKSWRQFE